VVGGYVDAVLRRAATKGDGWLTYFYTPESYRRSWEKIEAFAREAGRDPKTLTGTNQLAIYVGRSRAETEAPLRRWLETEWDVAAWSESTIEHAIRGSVEECVAQLSAHAATGGDRLILIPYRYAPAQGDPTAPPLPPHAAPGLARLIRIPHRYEPAQVELIAREILPRLAEAAHVRSGPALR